MQSFGQDFNRILSKCRKKFLLRDSIFLKDGFLSALSGFDHFIPRQNIFRKDEIRDLVFAAFLFCVLVGFIFW
jgi:hypothetical protein